MMVVIGVDIGGTKIKAGIVDEMGEIKKIASRPTLAEEGREAVLARIFETIDELDIDGIAGIGLGTPGFIDAERGIVTFAGNIEGWTGLNLKDRVSSRYDRLPVFIDNDANIAAMCEGWLGAGKGLKSFAMITLGTGLGGAYYEKNLGFLIGAHFQGAEFGHIVLYPHGDYCTCGQLGCAEAYCSGTALVRHYHELTGESLSGEEIMRSVNENINCKKVVERYQEDIGIYLSTLRNVFDPEAIIIGGGVIQSKAYWWEGMIQAFNDYCNRPQEVAIKPAEYLNDAGVIGGAKLAFDGVRKGHSNE